MTKSAAPQGPPREFDPTKLDLTLLRPVETLGGWADAGMLAAKIAVMFEAAGYPIQPAHLLHFRHERWVHKKDGRWRKEVAPVKSREMYRIYVTLQRRQLDDLLLEMLAAAGWVRQGQPTPSPALPPPAQPQPSLFS